MPMNIAQSSEILQQKCWQSEINGHLSMSNFINKRKKIKRFNVKFNKLSQEIGFWLVV